MKYKIENYMRNGGADEAFFSLKFHISPYILFVYINTYIYV